jgi:GDP-4-dehydro-6-deoxy-D-mannose reductase
VRTMVTGSSGFVGHWLLRHLEEAGDVGIPTAAELDIGDVDALTEAVTEAQPDAIFHLAAQASVGASWKERQETYRVNVLGTVNVLDAALACSTKPRVLVVSSSEVYGRISQADLPVREGHPLAPVSPYAASKAAAEMAAIQAWLGSGLEVIRVRPFNHTGPGQRPDFVVPGLAQQVADASRSGSRTLRTGNLDSRRDITDVRDVVVAYRLLLEHGEPGEVYNVCRGESVSIREIAETLIELVGGGMSIEIDPERVRAVDIPELVGDPRRLAAATGWKPSIGLRQTLADVLAHWQGEAA